MLDEETLLERVLSLERWLRTMLQPRGYAGPVVHWWRNCFAYTGVGLDWRYEGIVLGYLNLFRVSENKAWLERAVEAGNQLVSGQLPGGNFRSSSFEMNPCPGGTPHEASCDIALLELSRVLKERGNHSWTDYATAARNNIEGYFIHRLWNAKTGEFRDSIRGRTVVPNKVATLVEAIIQLQQGMQGDELINRYVVPSLDGILKHQVSGGTNAGAIHQYSLGGRMDGRFFPFYIARCIPGLIKGFESTGKEDYLLSAKSAMSFLLRHACADGLFPQVLYATGNRSIYPRWIAGTCEVLRAAYLLETYGVSANLEMTLEEILEGQSQTGGFHTADGFSAQAEPEGPEAVPDFRDLMTVCGWNDKAFRYLTSVLPSLDADATKTLSPSGISGESTVKPCLIYGRNATYYEDGRVMEFRVGPNVAYRWRKGEPWSDMIGPCQMWK